MGSPTTFLDNVPYSGEGLKAPLTERKCSKIGLAYFTYFCIPLTTEHDVQAKKRRVVAYWPLCKFQSRDLLLGYMTYFLLKQYRPNRFVCLFRLSQESLFNIAPDWSAFCGWPITVQAQQSLPNWSTIYKFASRNKQVYRNRKLTARGSGYHFKHRTRLLSV